MGRHKGIAKITTSVRISPEFHELAIKHQLSFSEAMSVGISLMLAEMKVINYDNNLNISRETERLRLRVVECLEKIQELETKS